MASYASPFFFACRFYFSGSCTVCFVWNVHSERVGFVGANTRTSKRHHVTFYCMLKCKHMHTAPNRKFWVKAPSILCSCKLIFIGAMWIRKGMVIVKTYLKFLRKIVSPLFCCCCWSNKRSLCILNDSEMFPQRFYMDRFFFSRAKCGFAQTSVFLSPGKKFSNVAVKAFFRWSFFYIVLSLSYSYSWYSLLHKSIWFKNAFQTNSFLSRSTGIHNGKHEKLWM